MPDATARFTNYFKKLTFTFQGPKLDMDRVEKLEKENVELKASLAEVLKR